MDTIVIMSHQVMGIITQLTFMDILVVMMDIRILDGDTPTTQVLTIHITIME
jgi:hypothetical protein